MNTILNQYKAGGNSGGHGVFPRDLDEFSLRPGGQRSRIAMLPGYLCTGKLSWHSGAGGRAKSTATVETAPEETLVVTAEEPLVFEELPEAKTGEVIIPTPEPLAPSETPLPTTPAPSPVPAAAITPGPTIALTLPSPTTATPVPTVRVPQQVEMEEDQEVAVVAATPTHRPDNTPVPTVHSSADAQVGNPSYADTDADTHSVADDRQMCRCRR